MAAYQQLSEACEAKASTFLAQAPSTVTMSVFSLLPPELNHPMAILAVPLLMMGTSP